MWAIWFFVFNYNMLMSCCWCWTSSFFGGGELQWGDWLRQSGCWNLSAGFSLRFCGRGNWRGHFIHNNFRARNRMATALIRKAPVRSDYYWFALISLPYCMELLYIMNCPWLNHQEGSINGRRGLRHGLRILLKPSRAALSGSPRGWRIFDYLNERNIAN